jgi:lactoylglutathione lyase
MSKSIPSTIAPHRILYTMFRVRDLNVSIAFYRDMLGMSELGRETYSDAEFTVVFMGYGERRNEAVIELTHNWGENNYEHGTAFGNISLEVNDIFAVENFLKEQGVHISRAAGLLPIVSQEMGFKHTLAFITDPDGYRVELMQKPKV